MTFEEKGGQTLLVKHDLYPSKEALDGELASGAADGLPEQLEQLDELLVTLGADRPMTSSMPQPIGPASRSRS